MLASLKFGQLKIENLITSVTNFKWKKNEKDTVCRKSNLAMLKQHEQEI